MDTLYIDLDDVLLNTSKTIKQIRDYLSKNKEKFNINSHELDTATYKYLFDHYNKVSVKEEIAIVLNKLKSRYSVVFITGYISEAEYSYKSYLARYFDVDILFYDVEGGETIEDLDLLNESIVVSNNYGFLCNTSCSRPVFFGSFFESFLLRLHDTNWMPYVACSGTGLVKLLDRF